MCGPVAIGALEPWLSPSVSGDSERPTGLGGQPVTQLATALLEGGHDVVIVTLDRTVQDEVVLDGPNLRIVAGPYRRQHRARDAFRAERAYLRRALRRERPDVIHAHWTYEFALGALETRLPTLITVRDWAPAILRWHPHPYRGVRLLMNVVTLVRGRHFTATSPYIRNRLRRVGVRDVALIPNALPDGRFSLRDPMYNEDAPELIALNNGFSRWKNVTTLLQALPLIHKRLPQATLRLVGSGFQPGGPAHQWALSRRLDQNILFQGPVPNKDTISLLKSADLFVHPSLEESFGLVLLEAMATGLPVVGGERTGAVPWVLDEGRAGLLTDVTSPRSMADSVLTVLEQPALWRELSRRGFERAWSEFRLTKVTGQYLACYERIR